MKVTLQPSLGADTLNVIFSCDKSPRRIYEAFIEELDVPAVTQMVNEDTAEVVGWVFYDFNRKFTAGKLKENAIVPPTDMRFEIDQVSDMSLTLGELLQWAYDNLFGKKATA